jgi:MFS family permease
MQNLDKLSQKITLALLASQSFFSAALIISFTVGSIIMVELAGNDQWAGIPSTVILIGAALMAYPLGHFMDRFGRRPGLMLGFTLGIGGSLLAGWAVILGSMPLFLLGVLGLGLNRSANDLGRYAAAEAAPAHKRARAISLVVLGGTVGSVGGPAIFQWVNTLAERFQVPLLSAPWFAAAFFLGLALLVITVFLRPDPQVIGKQFAALDPVSALTEAIGRTKREIFAQPLAKIAVGAMICGQLAMVTVMTMTPVHMHNHQQPLSDVSWVIMAHTLGMFGLSFGTGWLVDRLGHLRMILSGGFVLALACLLAPLWDTVWGLSLSLFLLGLGWNFTFVAGSALLTTVITANEKGQIQGLTDAMSYVASGVGSVGSGFVFAYLGFLVMSWVSIIVALTPVVLVILLATPSPSRALEGTASR